jgi:hypothetical protein
MVVRINFRNHGSVSFGPVFAQSGQRAVISAPNRGVRQEISIGRLKIWPPICIKDPYQRYRTRFPWHRLTPASLSELLS